MGEHVPHHYDDDDILLHLEQEFEQDATFSREIDGLVGELVLREMAVPPASYETDVEHYKEPHDARPLAIHKYIVEVFREVCREYGIDPNTNQQPDAYNDIVDILWTELIAMQSELTAGDVIEVTNTMVLDIGASTGEDGLRVLVIPEGLRVVGVYSRPVIAPMPDEADAAIQDPTMPPAIGVGFVIESPVVVSEDGTQDTALFAGRSVIISLSPSSVELVKYQFTTPPTA